MYVHTPFLYFLPIQFDFFARMYVNYFPFSLPIYRIPSFADGKYFHTQLLAIIIGDCFLASSPFCTHFF